MKFLCLLLGLCVSAPAFAGVFAVTINQFITTNATSTSTKVLDTDTKRNYLLIQNNGSENITVKFGQVQTGGEGVVIPPGGNYEPYKGIVDSVWIWTLNTPQAVVILGGQ